MAQVWILHRCLKLDLYLYLPDPYLCTHMGFETHDEHYKEPSMSGTVQQELIDQEKWGMEPQAMATSGNLPLTFLHSYELV